MTLFGKHAMRIERSVGAIPIVGFLIRTRRMLRTFEHFEREQLPRLLRNLSELTHQQQLQAQALRRLAASPAEHSAVLKTPAKFAQLLHSPLDVAWGTPTPGTPTAQWLSLSEHASDPVDIIARWDHWPFPAESLRSISLATTALALYSDAELKDQLLPALLGKLQAGGHLYLSDASHAPGQTRSQQRWMAMLDTLGLDDVRALTPTPATVDGWLLSARKPLAR